MKKVIICLMLTISLCAIQASAQTEKEIRKDRKEQVKQSKKKLKEKATKDARKQAKELKKEGWKVGAGSLPLEKQIDNSMLRQMEEDAYGNPLYIFAEANSIGENIDAARFAAMEMAKVNLVQQFTSEMAGVIETTMGNEQLAKGEAVSNSRNVGAIRTILEHKISGLKPVVSIYRTLPNQNTECRVVVLYSRENMVNEFKQALREKLKEDGKHSLEQIECLIDGVCPIN